MNHPTKQYAMHIENDPILSFYWEEWTDALLSHAMEWEGIGGQLDYRAQENLRVELGRVIKLKIENDRPKNLPEPWQSIVDSTVESLQPYLIAKELLEKVYSLCGIMEHA